MENGPSEIELKTSRIFFLGNYIIASLVIVFIFLLYFTFDMKFTLFPKIQSEFTSTLILLSVSSIGAVMIEQPEWARFRTKLIVTMNEVIKQEGILNKERVVLPYATVADIRVEKSALGRILNYGTLSVGSFKAGSDMVMKGVRRPERIHVLIQNRVNLIREGQMEFFKPKDEDKEKGHEPLRKGNLENRKKELLELVEKTKESFYSREIEEEQFKNTLEKYQQQIMEIDVKLKNQKK